MEYYPNGRIKICNSAQGENHQHSEEAVCWRSETLLLEVLKERLADFSGHDLFMGWYMILYRIPF